MNKPLNFDNTSLEEIINTLIPTVRDPNFLSYLNKIQHITSNFMLSGKQILDLKKELYSNYMTYLKISSAGTASPKAPANEPVNSKPVNNDTKKLPNTDSIDKNTGDIANTVSSASSTNIVGSVSSTATSSSIDTLNSTSTANSVSNVSYTNISKQTGASSSDEPLNSDAYSQAEQDFASNSFTNDMNPAFNFTDFHNKDKKKHSDNALPKEFVIGTTIFSVIGALFILYAFVMLGMYFMNGILQGILFYIIPAIVIAISELFLHKKSEKLSSILTSIGICGLYLATSVNFIRLKNFNSITAIIIMSIITLGTLYLSKIRQLGILKIIGVFSCYFSIFPAMYTNSFGSLFIFSLVLVLLMNFACIFIPDKKSWFSIGILHFLLNTLFTVLMFHNIDIYDLTVEYTILFILVILTINNLILHTLHNKAKESQKYHENIFVSLIFYSIASLSIFVVFFLLNVNYIAIEKRLILIAVIFIVSGIYFLLERNYTIKYIHYYFLAISAYLLFGFDNRSYVIALCMLAILLSSKIIHLYNKYTVFDCVLTSIYCLYSLFYMQDKYGFIYMLGIIISMVFIKNYKLFYQFLLSSTLIFLSFNIFVMNLNIIISLLISTITIIVFNRFEKYKTDSIRAFNIFMAVCHILLLNIYGFKSLLGFLFYEKPYFMEKKTIIDIFINKPYLHLFRNISLHLQNDIEFVIILLISLITIIVIFTDKYKLAIPNKELFISLYLTYMIFVCRANNIRTSVFLMILALISIILGFVKDNISVRLYGLLLALFVCVKIVFFDYITTDKLHRILLFFITGIIALTISFTYIILEKKLLKNKND